MYVPSDEGCVYQLFQFNLSTLLGSILLCIIGGIASTAGLGGSGPSLSVLLLFFNYPPKQATFVVFGCILGSSFGNTLNQISKAIKGKPLIKYQLLSAAQPTMFMGSFIGLFFNKLMPTVFICAFILYFTTTSIKTTYLRYKKSHEAERAISQQNKEIGLTTEVEIPENFNIFQDSEIMAIMKNILIIVGLFFVLSVARGSSRFPSVLGFQPCSEVYWLLYFANFGLMGFFTYQNIGKLRKKFRQQSHEINEDLIEEENKAEKEPKINEK